MTSKKLPSVKKFGAIAAKSAISSAERQQQHPFAVREPARRRQRLYARASGTLACMIARAAAQRVDRHRRQNDRALDRALPVGADAQERQRRSDRRRAARRRAACRRACRVRRVMAAPPTTTAAITFISRPMPGVARESG